MKTHISMTFEINIFHDLAFMSLDEKREEDYTVFLS